ncbi:MAG: 6,7-dimethyl-8-ribityllumazine synthase [Chitinophagaceae bacterium]
MSSIGNSNLLYNTESILRGKGAFVVLIKTEWNQAVVDELETGCLRICKVEGIIAETITVPGAVEIPFAVQHYWHSVKQKKRPDAFIAFGCVVRGGTPHFEYVCQSVTSGITLLNTQLPVPVIFGVLTVNNNEEALERVGGVHGHKGEEAAITAAKMIALSRQINKG